MKTRDSTARSSKYFDGRPSIKNQRRAAMAAVATTAAATQLVSPIRTLSMTLRRKSVRSEDRSSTVILSAMSITPDSKPYRAPKKKAKVALIAKSSSLTTPPPASSCVPPLRTESFAALWPGTFAPSESWADTVQPHTLILGTHPSVVSLDRQEYYGHPMKYVTRTFQQKISIVRDLILSLTLLLM